METIERGDSVLLRDGQSCAYFIPSEMRLFTLDAHPSLSLESLAEIAAEKHRGAASERLTKSYSLQEREAFLPILQGQDFPDHKGPRLGRLTLIISNVCNLACSYCYVGADKPSSAHSKMSPEEVRQVLDRTLQLYPEIEVVHFFGGEPLMNLPAMEEAAEYLAEAVGEGRLQRVPKFAVTTNGTWSNPQVIELLKRWNMSVTVSWDGTRKIQDACRPLRSGASSYELLAETIARFKDAGISFDTECTYNGHHRKLGISIVDLMNFFYEQTGQRAVHIAPVFMPAPGNFEMGRSADYIDFETLAEDYREAARISVSNLVKGEGPVLEFAQRVVEHLATRIPAKMYCPAFFTQLTVAMDGSVYPCFMFAGDKAYRMGNLLLGTYPGPTAKSVLERYFEEFSSDNASWYSCLSEGCVAGEYLVSGTMKDRVMAPMQRAIAEECVLGLAQYLAAEQQVSAETAAS